MNHLAVMKFGGSSVATPQHIKHVAKIVAERARRGRVVVVVSAPGEMTDDLIARAEALSQEPSRREMDMLLTAGERISIALLSIALEARGIHAISFTGSQSGILTSPDHTRARILSIKPVRIREELRKGKVVVVAGFQGVSTEKEVTTLGRGGSDLTAVALASALKAGRCEIYTDVEGIFTADPRLVPEARKISRISWDEMLELAASGAQVMQARAIEVAKRFGVEIHVRSTFSKKNGTTITQKEKRMEEIVVSGVSHDAHQAKITLMDVPDKPGMASRIFGALSRDGINVDMIIQSAAHQRAVNDISFTVARADLPRALSALSAIARGLGMKMVSDENVAKVSIVGLGMKSHPGVAARMFEALARARVNIQMISTSEIKISCVVRKADVRKAAQALHKAFRLERENGRG